MRELEFISSEEDFWQDADRAKNILQEMEELRKIIKKIDELEKEIKETLELTEMAESSLEKKDLIAQTKELEKEINELEIKTLLGEDYDKNNAILSIHSGAGGVDAQDWSEMLLRMYLRYAQNKNFKTKIISESRGSEAGIKSATFEINGQYAYGMLKGEAGTHRLVRLSPFNSDNLRQTSFALVEVLPVIESLSEVVIGDDDLKIDTFRSSGAGGQSVNTTDSAVRITHLPSGLVTTCQSERSQLQNKEQAMKYLLAKLHKKFLEEKKEEKNKLRGEYHSPEWGRQIRSYVLHPYKMVKDHRTDFESVNPEDVLAGNIDDFINAFLEKKDKL